MSRLPVPKGIAYRGGAKVSWRTYATVDEAEAAASVARHNARLDAADGYDFGFSVPGTITKVDAGWEVCLP